MIAGPESQHRLDAVAGGRPRNRCGSLTEFVVLAMFHSWREPWIPDPSQRTEVYEMPGLCTLDENGLRLLQERTGPLPAAYIEYLRRNSSPIYREFCEAGQSGLFTVLFYEPTWIFEHLDGAVVSLVDGLLEIGTDTGGGFYVLHTKSHAVFLWDGEVNDLDDSADLLELVDPGIEAWLTRLFEPRDSDEFTELLAMLPGWTDSQVLEKLDAIDEMREIEIIGWAAARLGRLKVVQRSVARGASSVPMLKFAILGGQLGVAEFLANELGVEVRYTADDYESTTDEMREWLRTQPWRPKWK